jgi:hypothetical protein
MSTFEKFKLLALSLFALGMSSYSFYTTYNSYNLLSANADQFEAVVKNWKAKPITDVKWVTSAADCKSPYVLGTPMPVAPGYKYDATVDTPQSVGQWPGAYGWCECGNNTARKLTYNYKEYTGCSGTTYNKPKTGSCTKASGSKCSCDAASSITKKCSSQQLNSGCTQGLGSQKTKTLTATSYKKKTSTTTCTAAASAYTYPSNYKIITQLSYSAAGCANIGAKDVVKLYKFNNKILCYQRGGKSAIERPLQDKNGKCATGVSCGSYCADSEALCPIAKLNPTTSATAGDKKVAGMRPVIEVRMTMGKVCKSYTDGEGGIKNRVYEQGSYTIKHRETTGCTKEDDRYTVFDTSSEYNLLSQNGVTNSPTASLTNPSESFTETYSDTTKQRNTYMWYMSYRNEFAWNKNCTAGTMADLAQNLTPILEMRQFQRMLMWVNGFFGLLILGIIFPLTVIARVFEKDQDLDCIPGKGKQELKNINFGKGICGAISKVAKLAPLFYCLKYTGGVKLFFETVGKAQCSDATTNAVFTYLGDTVTKVDKSNYQTLAIDCVGLVVAVLGWMWQCYKGTCGCGEGDGEEEEESNGELALTQA